MPHTTPLTSGSLSYLLDADDRIEAVDEGWQAFAAANGAPELTAAAVLGRPLGAFIADRATTHLSRALLALARRGSVLTFPFRCDAPALRRHMRMVLSPEPRGRVRCETTLVTARPLAPSPPARGSERTGAPLTMCSWCNRIRLAGRWYELADAVAGARLFLASTPSEITHGLCHTCERKLDPESGFVPA